MAKRRIEDMDCDDLRKYCPLPEDHQGGYATPNGYISCEGCCCEAAYEEYLESEEDLEAE